MSASPSIVRAVRCAGLALVVLLLACPAVSAREPNTGKAGSPCRSVTYDDARPDDDLSLDTTSLGPTAPAPYEIGAPISTPERDEPVQRVMILLHGGGWYTVGRDAVRSMRAAARE